MKRINISNYIKAHESVSYSRHLLGLAKGIYEKKQQIDGIRPDTLEYWKKDVDARDELYNEALLGELNIRNKIMNEIKLAEGKARVRCIYPSDILDAVKKIESHFNTSMKSKEGASFKVDVNDQDFPNAYKGRPESTWFRLEVHSGKWYLTNIWRDYTARYGKGIICDVMPESLAKAVMEQYLTF